MKSNKIFGATATIALALGVLVSVPATAQAVARCDYTTRSGTFTTSINVGTGNYCALVQARATEYNNYGLAGTYTGPQSASNSTAYAPESVAPGTYVSHTVRYKARGGSWSAWISV